MSRIEPKAGEWLRQQIEELGALRTASVRDPQFKAWRQNTLTFIQRIWQGDQNRSERFRRIPFSPPSTRADARAIREQFERGCGEALEYLNTLLTSVGEEPVKPGTTRSVPTAGSESADSGPIEGDFPEVALGERPSATYDDDLDGVIGDGPMLDFAEGGTAPRERSSGPSRLPNAGSVPRKFEGLPEDFTGSTPLDAPAGPKPAVTPPPARPDSPGSKISIRGKETPPGRRDPNDNPLKGILDPHRRRENGGERPTRPGKMKKGGKKKLRAMLGLEKLEGRAAEPRDGNAPAPATPAAPPEVVRPEPPRSSPPPAAREPEEVFETPAPPSLPMDVVSEDVPEELTTDSPMSLTAEDIEASMDDQDAPEVAEEDHSGEAARATADFLRNSPVLSSAPRAVTRRTPVSAPSQAHLEPIPSKAQVEPIPSRESAVSQMLKIAAEVDSLGVPEGHRARARAALMDLARQLDEPEISWEVLRDAVHFVMEFPPIARRALPLLLPYLDLAA